MLLKSLPPNTIVCKLIEGDLGSILTNTNAFQGTFLPTMAKHALFIQPRYQNMDGVHGKHRKHLALILSQVWNIIQAQDILQVWNIIQALSFKPKTYFKFETSFKLSLSSPRHISSLKHCSNSLFQAQDIFQDRSFQAQDLFQAPLFQVISSLKHCSSSLFQAQDVFQDHSFKSKTFFKLPTSSPRHIWRLFCQAQNLFRASSFKAHFFKSFDAHPLLSLQASHMHKKSEVPIQNSHRNWCISKFHLEFFFPFCHVFWVWVDCTPCFEWRKGSHPDFCLLVCFYCAKS